MPDARPAPATEMQFADRMQQREVASLGIWVFLATEVLFFGGLLAAYATYRHLFPDGFAEAGRHTKIVLGTANTAILLTSSAFMAGAVEAAGAGRRRALVRLLLLTALFGAAFLGVKGYEYYTEYGEHLVPGLNFAFEPRFAGPAEIFFLFYFIATGIHAVHLTIGIVVVLVMAWRARHGAFGPEHHTPVEVTGLYWHFVDVVWIFLYPLLYLMGRSSA